MTEEKVVFVSCCEGPSVGVSVVSGDRVDCVGNVWDKSGAWKNGPDGPQPDIEPLFDFDDPLPENMGGESLDDYASPNRPAWLPKELFDGLVDAVADELGDREDTPAPELGSARENEAFHQGVIEEAIVDMFDGIRTYRLALKAAEKDGVSVAIDVTVTS